jgi:hypothetical protein
MNGELARLRRDVSHESLDTDSLMEHLEHRVIALEEIVAARWPRRVRLRVRLARQLRASVEHFDGGTWTERRIEATGTDWLAGGQK